MVIEKALSLRSLVSSIDGLPREELEVQQSRYLKSKLSEEVVFQGSASSAYTTDAGTVVNEFTLHFRLASERKLMIVASFSQEDDELVKLPVLEEGDPVVIQGTVTRILEDWESPDDTVKVEGVALENCTFPYIQFVPSDSSNTGQLTP